jgi:hypothetical protein
MDAAIQKIDAAINPLYPTVLPPPTSPPILPLPPLSPLPERALGKRGWFSRLFGKRRSVGGGTEETGLRAGPGMTKDDTMLAGPAMTEGPADPKEDAVTVGHAGSTETMTTKETTVADGHAATTETATTARTTMLSESDTPEETTMLDGSEMPPASEMLSGSELANETTTPAGSANGGDDIPDRPIPFGYKTSWIVVSTDKPEAIVTYFPRLQFSRSTWKMGQSGRIFISPPVQGWVFIQGDIPGTDSADTTAIEELLTVLSREFGFAAYFGSHRVVDYYAWVQAREGTIVRAFSTDGFEVTMEDGEKQGIERSFVYPHEAAFIDDSFQQDFPDEEMVLTIAGDWSLDPRTLDRYEANGFGFAAL